MSEPEPIHYWKPARRTRRCIRCDRRESIRSDMITVDGKPTSYCGTCWNRTVRRLSDFNRDRLTEGQPT